MKKANGWKSAALLLAAAMALTACSGGSGSSSGAAAESSTSEETGSGTYKDTLHITVTQQSPSLDLHKNSTLIARQMCDGTVWEKLVTLNAQSEAAPELCQSYEVSEDGKTITFVLRQGVKFHDGSVMDADDVVASMNRWIEGFSSVHTMVGDARFEKADELAQAPLCQGANGHGCGHNLLGAGAAAAALAVKAYLEDGHPGTVIFYGCPGEEGGSGKAFMARGGAFQDLDCVLTWHPSTVNKVCKDSSLANFQVLYSFYGRSAHAAACPQMGRSALDGLELMNVGTNLAGCVPQHRFTPPPGLLPHRAIPGRRFPRENLP